MPARSEIEEKIRDFAIQEGILGKPLPHDAKLEFGYEINYPPNSPQPVKIVALKPIDRKAVSFQIATQIAPPHVEALKKLGDNGIIRFFEMLKKFLLLQNLLYNIDVKNARYIISDIIYPDGLTEQQFLTNIRKVFNASLYLNITLNEMILG